MAEEVFNPTGSEGDPLASVEDAIELAACVGLARWLTDRRPDVIAVELDGSGTELWFVNRLTTDGFQAAMEPDDPELWARAREAWALLNSVSRAEHRVVSADEARHWTRGM